MGKGFNIFIRNSYWAAYYNNAPSVALKEFIKLEFDNNPCVSEEKDPDYETKRKSLSDLFTNEDWQYLIDNATSGVAKNEYRKHLTKIKN